MTPTITAAEYHADPRARAFADRVLADIGLDREAVVALEFHDEATVIVWRLILEDGRRLVWMTDPAGDVTLVRMRTRHTLAHPPG